MTPPKFYAGIGSRETPKEITQVMTELGGQLERLGWILRSGGARGADDAFAAGIVHKDSMSVYLPGASFNKHFSTEPGYIDATKLPAWKEALQTVEKYHPKPSALTTEHKYLHARNAFQVLGSDLKTPSRVVICWTEGGLLTGGTSQAIRIAKANRIPVINLGSFIGLEQLERFIKLDADR